MSKGTPIGELEDSTSSFTIPCFILRYVGRGEDKISYHDAVAFSFIFSLSLKWGYCSAKNETIAKYIHNELTENSLREIRRCLQSLRQLGLIREDVGPYDNGGYGRRLYTITAGQAPWVPQVEHDPDHTEEGGLISPGADQLVRQGGLISPIKNKTNTSSNIYIKKGDSPELSTGAVEKSVDNSKPKEVTKKEVAEHVFLTAENIEALKKLMTGPEIRYWVNQLSNYAAQNPKSWKKSYQDHYRVILSWRNNALSKRQEWDPALDQGRGGYAYPKFDKDKKTTPPPPRYNLDGKWYNTEAEYERAKKAKNEREKAAPEMPRATREQFKELVAKIASVKSVPSV